ncbi:hypothetical protein LshimejAT787_1003290 [Lyophyllum shimeji]|uniref:Uncharacterized protein n=1 Tax=Lyophyllum shimeji TaxID=47721 RepID=A0A9P3PUF2_LYOSH|nr:hypothetical protein LshimejAT787_1003290 [Lyophyllum shimeji]
MEDPWANAWGEPAKPSAASRTTWSHSAKPSLGGLDAEADIAVPSWATGAAVQWSEPSEDPATIWHPNLAPAKEWVTSPYEDLPLGKSVSNPIPQRDRSPSPEHAQTTPSSPRSAPVSPKLPLEYTPPTHDVLPPEDHSSTPISAPASPPGTPDAFGTFETGIHAVQDDLDPWAQSVVPPDTHKADGQEEDLWAPSWGASDSATEIGSSDKPVDEWEAAKQRKAKQDQHVPPHVLASILDEFRALSKELWPSSSDEETVGANGRRSGIDNVEGLAAIENRLIPQDLTLPQYVHFSKTFTSKHMGESLRLTRHVPITRLSPFTLYLASKGSTAWETSVKSRVEVAADDLLPPGWRVVEKDKEETKPTIDTKKKGSGGLLSFFGRRAPATPSESNSRRSESPGRTQPASTFLGVSSTSATSPVVAVTPPNTESSKPVGAGPSTPVAIASPPSTSASSGTTSTSTPAVQPSQPTSDVSEPALAPSAVSRFLNRFSRGKSSGTSARNSLALSTEDLEFLSDIVPSANDEVDEDAQLQQLSTMISSSPLPTKLPPALAPPPRPPPPPRAASNASSITHERLPPPPDTHDDLFSLFNSPPSSGQSSAPALQPVPSAFSRPPSQSSAASSAIPPLPLLFRLPSR